MNLRKHVAGLLIAATGLTATGCSDDFFRVRNPNEIEAETVDPVEDGRVFSRSAFQNFAVAYGNLIVYSAWFTAEAWVGDTFPTRNEFGRRNVDDRNGTFNSEVWWPLGRALSTSDEAVEMLAGTENAARDVNLARAALSAGYSYQLMAEMFCSGVARGGPELSTAQLLEQAVERFTRAREVGLAVTTVADTAEARRIARAALVGRARAHLQAGRNADAAADAAQVPENFTFNMVYVDDPSFRGRLGNGVYFYSAGGSRESLVVPPVYRAMADAGDTRIRYADAGRFAQDGELRLFTQRKFETWAAPIRLASTLEARYIQAEAELKQGNPARALALITERRTAGNQGAFVGTTNEAILAELMAQRSRDFWLEAKRFGDWRRNGAAVPNIIPPGNTYYKPQVGTVSDQTCWPIPHAERNANPNL